MRLRSCLKRYRDDTHRTLSPEETLARVEPKMPAAGVTRVADITNLDRVGIPVFSSIRPMADKGAISVYNGKGASPVEARVSAMMEGVERYSSEVRNRELITARYSDLHQSENALDPSELNLPASSDPDSNIPWILGQDILNDEEIMVPANAVFHPLPEDYRRLFRTNTNGLASGNELEEAIFHGLAEVVERDAWALAEAKRDTGPVIRNVTDSTAIDLLDRFARAEVVVHLKDITSDIGIPTCAASSDDIKLKDPILLTNGMGTHVSARIAILRALTEVAQSRLTQIHGAREDTVSAEMKRQIGYERMKRINKHWFDESREEDFSILPSFESDDFLEDVRYVTRKLEEAGLERVIVVNLTREEIGVPVVRVIVPGLEMSAVDPERIGRRHLDARKAKSHRLLGAKPPAR